MLLSQSTKYLQTVNFSNACMGLAKLNNIYYIVAILLQLLLKEVEGK